MSPTASVSVLLLCLIISETNEYDCPEFAEDLCKENSPFENRDRFECTSDYVCRIGQKCCSSCKYGYKICTDVVEKAYLTDLDKYLKNKYCPKVKPCFTPLKYNAKYRCFSDELCSPGYKCCKSDCYIHKVCVVPIDKGSVEADPPPTTTTSTTTEEETVSTVIITSIKFPKTTLFVPITRPDETGSYDEADSNGEASREATVTKPSMTTSSYQSIYTPIVQETTKIQKTTQVSTETAGPIRTSSRRTSISPTVSTVATNIQATTQRSTVAVAPDDGFTDDYSDSGDGETQTQPNTTLAFYTKLTTVSEHEGKDGNATTTEPSPATASRGPPITPTPIHEETSTKIPETTRRSTTISPTVTTVAQEISTKIQESTQKSTEFPASGNRFADDDEDGADNGSGDGELIEMRPITTKSPFYAKVTAVSEEEGNSGNVTTRESSTTTSFRESTFSPTPIHEETSTKIPEPTRRSTTISPTVTTVAQEISTKIQETTQKSTEFPASGNRLADDDEDGADNGSGDGYLIEMRGITTKSPFYAKVTAVSEKEGKSGNITTRETSTTTSFRESTFSPTPIHEETSAKIPETTRRSTTIAPTVTTVAQETTTRIQETAQRSTEFPASGNILTDDDEDGADNGSGDGELIELRPTTTKSPFYAKVTAVSEEEGKSGNVTTRESSTTTSFRESTFSPTPIHEETSKKFPETTRRSTTISPTVTTVAQEISTKIQETTQKSTEFPASVNRLADDDEDGADNGSGDGELIETRPITTTSPSFHTKVTALSEKEGKSGNVTTRESSTTISFRESTFSPTPIHEETSTKIPETTRRSTTIPPTVTNLAQETSTKIQETTQKSTEFPASINRLADDDEDGADNGSGDGELIETRPITTTSPSFHTKVTAVSEKEGKSGNVSTRESSTTTSFRESTFSPTPIHEETSTKIPETTRRSTTISPTVTTVAQEISTKIQETTQKSTEFPASGNKFADDDEDGADNGSGDGELIEMRPITTKSPFYAKVTPVSEKEGKSGNVITRESSTTTSFRESTFFPTPVHDETSTKISETNRRSTTISSTVTTVAQEISTKIQESTQKSTEFPASGNRFADDDEDGADNGSGDGELIEMRPITTKSPFYAKVTAVSEKEGKSGNVTTRESSTTTSFRESTFSPTPIHEETSTKIPETTRRSTTISPTVTTVAQEISTKIQETTQKSTEFSASGNRLADDDEDGADNGSGDGELIEMRPITTKSPFYAKVTAVSEKEGKSGNVTTRESSTTTSFGESNFSAPTVIHKQTSNENTETTQRSTVSAASGGGLTDDDVGSVTITQTSTTTSSGKITSPTAIHQNTSKKIPETTQRSTDSTASGDGFTDNFTDNDAELDGDDGDYNGSGDGEVITAGFFETTFGPRKATRNEENSATDASEAAPQSTVYSSFKIGKDQASISAADFVSSRNGFITDDDGSYGNGSGDDKGVEIHQPITGSHSRLSSTTITADLQFSDDTKSTKTPSAQLPSRSVQLHSTTTISDMGGRSSETGLTDDKEINQETSQFTKESTLLTTVSDLQETPNITSRYVTSSSLNLTLVSNFDSEKEKEVKGVTTDTGPSMSNSKITAINKASSVFSSHSGVVVTTEQIQAKYCVERRGPPICSKWCLVYNFDGYWYRPKYDCCAYEEKPGYCPSDPHLCSYSFNYYSTKIYECHHDYNCPIGYKCCTDSCYAHKVCQPCTTVPPHPGITLLWPTRDTEETTVRNLDTTQKVTTTRRPETPQENTMKEETMMTTTVHDTTVTTTEKVAPTTTPTTEKETTTKAAVTTTQMVTTTIPTTTEQSWTTVIPKTTTEEGGFSGSGDFEIPEIEFFRMLLKKELGSFSDDEDFVEDIMN